MQLGELIYEVGGGIPNGKAFKAAQLGGPSGGCIPKEHLNVPVDYSTLQELGAIMGSGGVIVMDEDTCMVDIARFFLEFTQEESCGKCPPCRVGTKRMLEIVQRICNGEGEEGDIERLIALGETIRQTALCGLGQTAPNPVLSTIRHFRHEYEAHIRDKHCEAGVCANLFKARCSNACPASVNIPGFVSLVAEQRFDEALKLHRERNPLASVCARVCFHPCESKCMRASLDGALAIRHVKRFMVEQETEVQLPEVLENAANAARKVAVVGSGPAGLSAAYFLARLGYKPVVFEAEPRAGGMLVQAIPAYRLPRKELEREVEMIETLGVRFEYGKALGRDFTLQSLKDQGYEAVFVGVGAPQGTGIGVPGEDGPGVYDGLSFLKEYNLSGKGEVGKNVAVIGGGNAAIDAARTALRLGAESVRILYRRTRAQMPAWSEEIDAADLEGIDIMTLVAPEEILRDASGKVTGVRCRRMALGDYDRSGRRQPVAGHDPDFVVEADTVIAAIGQKLDAAAVLDGAPVELNRWGYLAADPNTGRTSVDWVFTGGDAATGPASVVEAIGAGEKAAAAMDEYLTGANHAFWRRDVEPPTVFDPDADPEPVERHRIEELAVDARVTNFDEVELGWAAEVAIAEAKRCLRCDYGKYDS
jgi:NADH-quinone oxidoreductase subunit F